MKIVWIISIIIGFSFVAHADRVRNGGTYVTCSNLSYFYDLYELTKIQKIEPVIPIGKNPFQMASDIIDRQSDQNIVFKNLLRTYLQDMKKNMIFSNQKLIINGDIPTYTIQRDCQMFQAAVSGMQDDQWVCYLYGGSWDLLDYDNQTALILHEIIYRITSDLGATTSTSAKLINQKLLVTKYDDSNSKNSLFNLRKKLNALLPQEH
ncbi:MAG: hypothetical protein H7256_04060 [Bdellovibrio sp.]|nr:hypothetical protein [Bdellovibrio sp.]